MIGELPKRVPLRCRLGRHVGQERGGLLMFICSRCGGAYWQTDPKYREAMDRVKVAEARNDLPAAWRAFSEAMPEAAGRTNMNEFLRPVVIEHEPKGHQPT